jgi:Icc-related predicted phosphoesterase
MTKQVRILFTTDLHGSRKTFLKFLKALKLYKADVGIIGGDLTGKVVVPVVKKPNGIATAEYSGQVQTIDSDARRQEVLRNIEDCGYYPVDLSEEEVARLKTDGNYFLNLFKTVVSERLKQWTLMARERLNGSGIDVYITGGNDDFLELDDVLRESDSLTFAEGKVEMIGGTHEMISSGYANITPWKCPRDVTEEELFARIDEMAKKVNNMESAIFNLHCPPIDSMLDRCTQLDTTYDPPRPLIGVDASGGSVSVRKIIETYQPALSLHGHIHESRGIDRIGRTVCLNPGSEYSEGILRSILVTLGEKKVDSFQFLSV